MPSGRETTPKQDGFGSGTAEAGAAPAADGAEVRELTRLQQVKDKPLYPPPAGR